MNIPSLTPVEPRMRNDDLHPAHEQRKERHRREPVRNPHDSAMARSPGGYRNSPSSRSPRSVSHARNYITRVPRIYEQIAAHPLAVDADVGVDRLQSASALL